MGLSSILKNIVGGQNAAASASAIDGLKRFFSLYNCTYTVDDQGEKNKFTRFTFDYQGGHFIAYAYNDGRGVEVIFPRMIDVPMHFLNMVRSLCNRGNSASLRYKFSYNINEKENLVGVHVSFYDEQVDPHRFCQSVAGCFSEQRDFSDALKDMLDNANNLKTDDLEHTYARNDRELFLMREQEMIHQSGDINWHFNAEKPFLLRHFVDTFLGRPDIHFVRVEFANDNSPLPLYEDDEIDSLSLIEHFIMANDEDGNYDFTVNTLTMAIAYTTPLSQSADAENVLMITLTQEGRTDKALYFRVTATLVPDSNNRANSILSNAISAMP